MTNIAIKVENLSKRYRIGLKEEMHDTLAGAMKEFVRRPFTNLRRLRQLSTFSENGREPDDVLWALRDVSFEVKQGEVVGIIGRNGAGKSTLLKILSRITYPTSGHVEMRGRVSSLLEVGTGFHPELTGRENIYLNGTILGMRKREIDRKFDEIVDFSGVERFIDTPVKRYSSGMKVRLAFSVAAHLEPEILIVDEVLAVGDATFQKKCLGKMQTISNTGRTVLFVSHNMTAINQLCSRAIWIENGQIATSGDSQQVVSEYLTEQTTLLTSDTVKEQLANLPLDENLALLNVELTDNENIPKQLFQTSEIIGVNIIYQIHKPTYGLRIGFDLCTIDGTILLRSFDDDIDVVEREAGIFSSYATLPRNILNAGNYYLDIAIGIHGTRWIVWHNINVSFEVMSSGNINGNYSGGNHPGYFLLNLGWQTVHKNGDLSTITSKGVS